MKSCNALVAGKRTCIQLHQFSANKVFKYRRHSCCDFVIAYAAEDLGCTCQDKVTGKDSLNIHCSPHQLVLSIYLSVPPSVICCLSSSPHPRLIYDIVVNQGGRVDHFGDHCYFVLIQLNLSVHFLSSKRSSANFSDSLEQRTSSLP